jgi:anti-sigma-K factor RskA
MYVMNFQDDDELSATAGEYVLGTLRGEERDAFEREMASNFKVRREVYEWQDRLFSLNLVAKPAQTPATLWGRIEQRLPAFSQRDDARGASSAQPGGFWSRLNVWRWTGAAGFALAALLAAALVLRPTINTVETQYVAVLQSPDRGMAGWVVDASNPRELRMIPLVDNTLTTPNSMEIWTKAEGAARPTSLGLLPTNAVTIIPKDRLPTLEGNQLFEITLEPPNGSPTGGPTGPILFLGKTVSLPSKKTL